MLRLDGAVLQEIFSLLPPKDILSCSATCKRFNGIVTSSSSIQLILYRTYLHIPAPLHHTHQPNPRKAAIAAQELTRIVQTEHNLQNLQPRYDSFILPSKQKILAVGEGYIVTQNLNTTQTTEESVVAAEDSTSRPDITIWSRSPSTRDEHELRWTNKELRLPVRFEEDGVAVDVREGLIAVIATRNTSIRWNGNRIEIWLFRLFNDDALAEPIHEKPLEVELGSPNIYSPAEVTFIPGDRLQIKWEMPISVQILDLKCRADIKTIRFPLDDTFDPPQDLVYVGEDFMVTHVTISGFFKPTTSGYILIYDLTNIPSMTPHSTVTQPDLVLCFPRMPADISHFLQFSSDISEYGLELSRYDIDHQLTHISSSLSLDALLHVDTPVRPPYDESDIPSYDLTLALNHDDIQRLVDLSKTSLQQTRNAHLDPLNPLCDMFGLFGRFTYLKWDEWQDKCFVESRDNDANDLDGRMLSSWAWGHRRLSMSIDCDYDFSRPDHPSPCGDSMQSTWRLYLEYRRIDLAIGRPEHLGKALGGLGDIPPCATDTKLDGQTNAVKPSNCTQKKRGITKGDDRSYSLTSMDGWFPVDGDGVDLAYICSDGRMVAYQNTKTDEVSVWDFGPFYAN